MSHSSSSTIAATTQPLSDVLPWGSPLTAVTTSTSSPAATSASPSPTPGSPSNSSSTTTSCCKTEARTLLVTDSISTDARFILHTLALQFLSSGHHHYNVSNHAVSTTSNDVVVKDDSTTMTTTTTTSATMMEGSVLWISCGPLTEKQVYMGLRKGMQVHLGGNVAVSSHGSVGSGGVAGGGSDTSAGSTSGGMGKLHVISLPLELADAALASFTFDDEEKKDKQEKQEDAGDFFMHETYLKQLHRRILHWLYHRELLSMSQFEKQQQKQKQSQQQTSQKDGGEAQSNNETMQQNTTSAESKTSNAICKGPNLIIIDNATMFSSMFGNILTSQFLFSVRASLNKHAKVCSTSSSVVASPPPSSLNTSTTTTATPTMESITNITSTNLLTIRSTSPDDGGLYQLGDILNDSNNDALFDSSKPKGETMRSEHSRILRPWLGMGSGGGGGTADNFVNSTSNTSSSSSAMSTPANNANFSSSNNNCNISSIHGGMGGTLSSIITTTSKIEEQSHHLSFHHPAASSPSLLPLSGLYESVDGIVDVSPLESGYARDVLGRVSFVCCWGGRGWWGRGVGVGSSSGVGSGGSGNDKKKDDIEGAYGSICVNYRCDDSGVRVMKLRSR